MRKTSTRTAKVREYDFSHGVRGKDAKRFASGTNLVPVAADLAKDFPDAEAVDRALRRYREVLFAVRGEGAAGKR